MSARYSMWRFLFCFITRYMYLLLYFISGSVLYCNDNDNDNSCIVSSFISIHEVMYVRRWVCPSWLLLLGCVVFLFLLLIWQYRTHSVTQLSFTVHNSVTPDWCVAGVKGKRKNIPVRPHSLPQHYYIQLAEACMTDISLALQTSNQAEGWGTAQWMVRTVLGRRRFHLPPWFFSQPTSSTLLGQ